MFRVYVPHGTGYNQPRKTTMYEDIKAVFKIYSVCSIACCLIGLVSCASQKEAKLYQPPDAAGAIQSVLSHKDSTKKAVPCYYIPYVDSLEAGKRKIKIPPTVARFLSNLDKIDQEKCPCSFHVLLGNFIARIQIGDKSYIWQGWHCISPEDNKRVAYFFPFAYYILRGEEINCGIKFSDISVNSLSKKEKEKTIYKNSKKFLQLMEEEYKSALNP